MVDGDVLGTDQLLTCQEVGAELGLSAGAVYGQYVAGRLRVVRRGRHILIPASELVRFRLRVQRNPFITRRPLRDPGLHLVTADDPPRAT